MRLIDADALGKRVKEFRDDAPQSSIRRYVCNVILSMLGDENQTPTIEAEPVQHGYWENANSRPKTYIRKCSVCGKEAYFCGRGCSYKFCPNCGAKMDKEG